MSDNHDRELAREQAYVDGLFARLDAEVTQANERLAQVQLEVDPANPDADALIRRETEYHGSGGLTAFGISAVDTALWDCLGKSLGVPCWALWGAIPGALKAYWKVNEVCVTILMNYVAIYFTSYLVGNPFSARASIPRTPTIEESARLLRILRPSRANIGLFVALGVLVLVWWMLYHTNWGYKLRHVGQNPSFSEYVGIPPKKVMIWGMILSGAIGGLAGAIEVMGIHGHFLDNFSPGIAFDGMLASLIAKNDIRMVPVLSLFLAVLKTGALGMERFTGVPKTLIDTIIAVFILLAAMEGLFAYSRRRSARSSGEEAA